MQQQALSKGRLRFYRTVDVAKLSHGYGVFLDGRPIAAAAPIPSPSDTQSNATSPASSSPSATAAAKKPIQTPLLLPTKMLAMAVAQEWDAQAVRIEPSTMPLTTLTSSALDLAARPEARKPHMVSEMLRYLGTDTTLVHTVPEGEPNADEQRLMDLEKKMYHPLVDWMKKTYGDVDIVPSNELRQSNHPKSTYESVRKRLDDMGPFELVATESFTQGCKSLIIALALTDRAIDVERAFQTSRVEEEHQLEKWGVVEGGHDIDRVNLKVQLYAASTLLLATLSENGKSLFKYN